MCIVIAFLWNDHTLMSSEDRHSHPCHGVTCHRFYAPAPSVWDDLEADRLETMEDFHLKHWIDFELLFWSLLKYFYFGGKEWYIWKSMDLNGFV